MLYAESLQSTVSAQAKIKLDELIRANKLARNAVLDLEELDEKELNAIRDEYLALAKTAHEILDEKSGK